MTKKKEEELKYIASNNENPAVLGTLVGPCADIINPTRNGRGYSEELWEKVFSSDIVKEHFENGGIFGELGHPADRSETDMEKIAVCMKEPPKKDKNGLLIGKWDILNTPNGRILKTLVDYGYKVGISSRGTGEVYVDENGNELVDSDSYDFQAFDVVILPAVKSARLSPVMESVGNKTLQQALNEAVNKSTAEEKKIMLETLETIGLTLVKETDESIPEEDGDKITEDRDSEKSTVAVDNGTAELIKSLQEAVKAQAESNAKLLELQNKLAVSDAKVSKVEEELSRYKATTVRLSALAKESKGLKKQISELTERLEVKNRIVKTQTAKIKQLTEEKASSDKVLSESISKRDLEIRKLSESIIALKNERTESEKKMRELTESIDKLTKTSQLEKDELNKKLSKTEKIAESYKKIANDTVKRYIESKATMLGVTVNEIRNRLSETYTIDDIDQVCEELKTYALNISKLPFNVDRNVKVRVTESKNDILRQNSGMDDDVDDSLLTLAGLQK